MLSLVKGLISKTMTVKTVKTRRQEEQQDSEAMRSENNSMKATA